MNTHAAARAIGVSPTTLHRLEAGYAVRSVTERRMIEGFDRLGVEILWGNGTGVFLRRG